MKKAPSDAAAAPEPEHVRVHQLPIELSQFIKFAGVTGSGGEAKQLITDGEVLLNGVVETRRGKKLSAGDTVTLGNRSFVVDAE